MKRTTEPSAGGHDAVAHPREIDRDINLRAVAATVAGIFVGTVVAAVAMWFFFTWLVESAEEAEGPVAAAVRLVPPELPPGPRLQASPEQELRRMRAHENEVLASYGWADPAAGRVRIPIDRAIEVLAARGLPPRRGPAPAAAGGPAGDGAGEAATGGAAAGAAGGDAAPGGPAPATAGGPARPDTPALTGTEEEGGTGPGR
jgi:hypothetical protein